MENANKCRKCQMPLGEGEACKCDGTACCHCCECGEDCADCDCAKK